MPAIEFYIYCLLGALAHALKKLLGLKDFPKAFSFSVWWGKNGIRTILGLILSLITLTVLPDQEITKWTAFLAGFSFDSILKVKSTLIKSEKDDNK